MALRIQNCQKALKKEANNLSQMAPVISIFKIFLLVTFSFCISFIIFFETVAHYGLLGQNIDCLNIKHDLAPSMYNWYLFYVFN